MADDRRVMVATKNKGKLVEIRAAFPQCTWDFVTPEDLGEEPPVVEEEADAFADNALTKAAAYLEAFGLPTLADDSGLVVDALGGAPGVRSSRYAGEHATDEENNAKLLAELEDVEPSDRTARFVCAAVYLAADGKATTAHGVCEGRIDIAPKGSGGFGYDPLFRPDEAPGRTMAELDIAEKNTLSHRGRALRALHDQLMSGTPRKA